MQATSEGCRSLEGRATSMALPDQGDLCHTATSSGAAAVAGCQRCNAADGSVLDAGHRQGGPPGIEGLNDVGALPAVMWASRQLRVLPAASGSAWHEEASSHTRHVQPMLGTRKHWHQHSAGRGAAGDMDQHHGSLPDALARRQLHLHCLQPLPAVPGDAQQQGAARVAGEHLHTAQSSASIVWGDTPCQLPLPCADHSAMLQHRWVGFAWGRVTCWRLRVGQAAVA